jgi:hypothetical protein
MYTLASDEKTFMVMFYTQTAMLRGEAIVKNALTRVSTWLRTQGAPEYIHLVNVQMLDFANGPMKTTQYPEFYLPIQQVVAFHPAPPDADPPDYDENESNRVMQPVTLQVGSFIFNSSLRLSGNSSVGSQLEASHSPWISVYEIAVSNPNMPGLQLKVPMALISPMKVLIGMS